MLDYAIVFVLGFLLAGLLSFAMLPAVWARALRLTRRRLEASIPISMAEVRAGRDQMRAEAALDLRRLEERVEKEWTLRHGLMAENGRQSEEIRLVRAELQSRERRIGEAEEVAAAARMDLAETRQSVATLKAELAAARVTVALRDDVASDQQRALDVLRMEIDGRKVEIVALNTRLATAEDEAQRQAREAADLVAAGVERDGRIAALTALVTQKEQALAAREEAAAALQGRIGHLEARLAEALKDGAAFELAQSELETRLMALAGELRKREAALAERDGRLAFANGRESELVNEIARLKASSKQALADLSRTSTAGAQDRRANDGQLEILKAERLRLQAELTNLKRDARNSWLALDEQNHLLRLEITKVAATIARDAALRKAAGSAVMAGLVPANDEAGLADLPLHTVGEVEERAEAPPV